MNACSTVVMGYVVEKKAKALMDGRALRVKRNGSLYYFIKGYEDRWGEPRIP